VTLTLDEDSVLASGGTQSQLIEGQDLASSLKNASASSVGDTQGANLQSTKKKIGYNGSLN
jgi:hypothetical protein